MSDLPNESDRRIGALSVGKKTMGAAMNTGEARRFWATGNPAPTSASDRRKQDIFRERVLATLAKARKQGPVVEEFMVGPLEATVLLEMSWGNRGGDRSSVRRIGKLADAIDAGKWTPFTGGDLKLSIDGQLLDYHHRLKAIATSKSGRSVLVRMQIGVPAEQVAIIDWNQGGRNQVDQFTMRSGILITNRVAAIIRSAGRVAGLGESVTFDELYDRFSESWGAISGHANRKYTACVWGPIVCMHTFAPKEALEFAEKVSYGANCNITDPAFLVFGYAAKVRTTGATAAHACEATICMAIRNYINKKPIVKLQQADGAIDWIREQMAEAK